MIDDNNPTTKESDSIIKVSDVSFKKDFISDKTEVTNQTRIRAMDDFMTYEVTVSIPYLTANDANYYPTFYIATQQCFLLEVKLRHEQDSAGGIIDVEKLTSGTARGSGVSMIASTFSVASGAKTTQRRLPSTTLANAQLVPGDAVAVKPSGTIGSLSHLTVTLLFGINNQNISLSANV